MAEMKKIATRDAYGQTLVELGNERSDIVVLDADLAAATKTGMFKKAHPDRFFDAGIAESNMIGVAAGLAAAGKTVFASSFAMFAAGRAFEQVRNSVAYPRLNVKIAATHAGVSVGEDGATHQCCEDIGLMRTIPGMVILNPADGPEAAAAVRAAADYKGPVYLRLGRLAVPVFNEENVAFTIGKGKVMREGTDATVIATGLEVNEAMIAADTLAAEGISVRVVNMATIKPIDKDIILRAAADTGAIVTAEEHNVIGGLGSAVAEVLCESGKPVPMLRVGVEDAFGRSGPALELLELYGLTAPHIVEKVKAVLTMK
ncbi:MAG: transketolase family protein [Clostridia bacterium]|nr:transketolase family protein [Clostridia bacterium]